MIVNESKTEIMWIGKNPSVTSLSIGTNTVPLTNSMKALGIYIEGNLGWDTQANNAINKSKKILSSFRFLRKYLTESQFLKAASANYYGSVYYGASVWFNSLKAIYKKKLNSLHFRLLRTAKRDYKMTLKRTELTELCKRATPEQWTKFIIASRVIKIMRDRNPTHLYESLTKAYFEERRYPGIGLFFDLSKTKVGRQSLPNRLIFMRTIKDNWNLQPLSNDEIRIKMKRFFFPYYTSQTQSS
jgi:hypothetical protein